MYIERPADRDLYDRLSHGDDCLVLSPPKTGKSFLLERMRSRLEVDYHSNPSRSESEVAKTCSKYVPK